jgi:hypothetical protein
MFNNVCSDNSAKLVGEEQGLWMCHGGGEEVVFAVAVLACLILSGSMAEADEDASFLLTLFSQCSLCFRGSDQLTVCALA